MTAEQAVKEEREYRRGAEAAARVALNEGLASVRIAAHEWERATRWDKAYPEATCYAYAAGFLDEALMLASLAEVEHAKRYPVIDAGRRDRLLHAPSRLDEQCAAGMRSRERSY